MEKNNNVYSTKVKAGKRTYFIDIKETNKRDYYLALTESKRSFNEYGEAEYFKAKLFLYKEDANKFLRALTSAVDKLKELMPDYDFTEFDREEGEETSTATSHGPRP